MRIAVIVRNLKIGGMQRAAINLAESFSQENHESHLIYFKKSDNCLEANSSVITHHFNLNKILKLTLIGLFLNIVAKLVNIMIRNSFFYFQGLYITPIFKWKIKKLEKKYGKLDLIIIRGQGTFEVIWPYNNNRVIIQQVQVIHQNKNLLNTFYKRILYSNKNILCNAASIYDDLEKNFIKFGIVPKKLVMISSPINMNSIIRKSNEYIPEFTEKYIVNIGRLAPTKNISLLIDAYAYAVSNFSFNYKLVIIGNGSQKEILKEQVKNLKLQNFIYFTGALSNPYPWLKNASLFVFTSKNEGLPNVLLESLACNTNIVSTSGKGGTVDIMKGELKNNLTSFNIKELAEKIVYVLQNDNNIDFSQYIEEYNPTKIINRYVKEFKVDA